MPESAADPATPVTAHTHFFAANRCWVAGDIVEAERQFRAAIAADCDLAEAHANLALLLDQNGRDGEAEHHYRRAIELAPDNGQIHLNFGAMLARQKRFGEAETSYRQALLTQPDSAAAWSNLGALQACRKQEGEAEASYLTALRRDENYRPARFNLSYLQLRQGRFEEGWASHEAREFYVPLESHFPFPRWQGEALSGKAILIAPEAGLGDMIQFCRYAPLLKQRGAARVDVLCHAPLQALLTRLTGVDTVLAANQPLPAGDWDYWVPHYSLPFHCQTRLDTIPAQLPYLYADPQLIEQWAGVIAPQCTPGDLRVGLVWQGNPRFENDADRSLPGVASLAPLARTSGVSFISLQKGAGASEAAQPSAALPLLDLAPQISDFADTAAILMNLDLLISVDTAVAHLAGALGKRCWLLLPDYKTDWRWLTERTDSPWYPQVMRLFRQSTMGDWKPVIEEVAAALDALASGKRTD